MNAFTNERMLLHVDARSVDNFFSSATRGRGFVALHRAAQQPDGRRLRSPARYAGVTLAPPARRTPRRT